MTLRETLAAAAVRGPSVVTVGTFDGVHRGHQHLLADVARRARRRGARAVAITFEPRPAEILRPERPSVYLCSLRTRQELLRSFGADAVIVVPFDRELSLMSAAEFARTLVEELGMCELVGGPDLALGHGREGTIDVMRQIGARNAFDVATVEGLAGEGEVIRTRVIRRLLEAGEVARAATLLGRRFAVDGAVVRGDGRGRQIGVPTANVAVGDRLALPANGVYAVHFHVDGGRWYGAANLGVRPTFAGSGRSLEVHVLDFAGDIYGRECSVEFVGYLRPEQRFGSIEELIRQIKLDVQHARQLLDAEH